MLVLSRQRGEVIVIGESIRIRVFKINTVNGTVDLAIDAPPGLRVLRGELVRRDPAVTRENRP